MGDQGKMLKEIETNRINDKRDIRVIVSSGLGDETLFNAKYRGLIKEMGFGGAKQDDRTIDDFNRYLDQNDLYTAFLVTPPEYQKIMTDPEFEEFRMKVKEKSGVVLQLDLTTESFISFLSLLTGLYELGKQSQSRDHDFLGRIFHFDSSSFLKINHTFLTDFIAADLKKIAHETLYRTAA
jgi:hypothetical protein